MAPAVTARLPEIMAKRPLIRARARLRIKARKAILRMIFASRPVAG
jgi:hypothetical protein